MKEMCMQLSTSYKEHISYGHVSEFDHDAWLIHVRYMVDEETLGRYFSRSPSAFLPIVTPQMFVLTVLSANNNIVQFQEMRTSLNNTLEYIPPMDLQKHSIQRRSNGNLHILRSPFGILHSVVILSRR
jgi:hypothetical protein